MAPLYEVYPANENIALYGKIESRLLGQTLIGRSQFKEHRCVRNTKLVDTSGITQILLQILVSGTFVGKCGGEDIHANIGDIVIMDYTSPFDFAVTDGVTISFAFDRQMISRIIDPRSLNGAVIGGKTAMGIVLTNLILAALSIAENKVECDKHSLETDLLEFIANQLKNNTKIKTMPAEIYKQGIIDYIDRNIKNPDLSPSHLIDRFNMSRSHIYRMFDEDGGVNNVIWDRRLKAVQSEVLRQPKDKKLYIKSLAYEFGCNDPTLFNKRFKKKFDYSPIDLLKSAESYENIDGNLFGIQKHFSNSVTDPVLD